MAAARPDAQQVRSSPNVGGQRRQTVSVVTNETSNQVDDPQSQTTVSDPHSPLTVGGFIDIASGVRSERRIALHALHVLEFALNAPSPRRHRTWLHRVTIAVDALKRALDAQLHVHDDDSVNLFAELALSEPGYAIRIQRLRQELLDLTVAVASLREQIEPDPAIAIDPSDIRDRLATITRRFKQHQAREADLVYEATGIELDDDFESR